MEKRGETGKTKSQEVERKLNGKQQKKNMKVLCNSDLKVNGSVYIASRTYQFHW